MHAECRGPWTLNSSRTRQAILVAYDYRLESWHRQRSPDRDYVPRPSIVPSALKCDRVLGSLYPALHRLEQKGIKAKWKDTENRRADEILFLDVSGFAVCPLALTAKRYTRKRASHELISKLLN
jgi:hypothetical protein